MPANLTHLYFAKKVLPLLAQHFPFIQRYEPALLLGTQGPDPFFFYGKLPWLTRTAQSDVHAFAHQLHAQAGNEALQPLLRAAHTDLERTYVIGAMLHFVLDCIVHPFVFYRSGFDAAGELSGSYRNFHSHYETMMDLELVEQLPSNFTLRSSETYDLRADWLKSISQLYHRAYPAISDTAFHHGTIHMREIFRVVHHPIASFIGKNAMSLILAMSLRTPLQTKADYLNKKQSTWYHPCTFEKSNDSVWALIEYAATIVESQCDSLRSWFSGACTVEQALSLPNLNYDGDPLGIAKNAHDCIYWPDKQHKKQACLPGFRPTTDRNESGIAPKAFFSAD
jgi:hypothetical protein